MPGKVLHLDGDANYLKKSMQVYSQLRVPAEGIHCHESQMSQVLHRMLPQFHPDIVVITGHDGVLKQREDLQQLSSYKNSLNFVQAGKCGKGLRAQSRFACRRRGSLPIAFRSVAASGRELR